MGAKYFSLALLVVTFAFAGCDDDEGKIEPQEEVIREHFNQLNVTADADGNLYVDGKLDCQMVLVKNGSFLMGAQSTNPANDNYRSNAYDSEGPVHEVSLTKDYLIGQCEVSQRLWRAVMGTTDPCVLKWKEYRDVNGNGKMDRNCVDSRYNNPADDSEGDGLGDLLPAYWIDYPDIVEFLKELNRMTGKEYRLPTEAEWEYAANGGQNATILSTEQGGRRFHDWAGSDISSEVCVFGNPNFEFGGVHLMECGSKAPNELGLYDMAGNVWEWCADYFSTSFFKANKADVNTVDPICTIPSVFRVIKGGGWESLDAYCYSSYRGIDCRAYGSNIRCYGLRLVLTR